jgi:hypothetical protein
MLFSVKLKMYTGEKEKPIGTRPVSSSAHLLLLSIGEKRDEGLFLRQPDLPLFIIEKCCATGTIKGRRVAVGAVEGDKGAAKLPTSMHTQRLLVNSILDGSCLIRENSRN